MEGKHEQIQFAPYDRVIKYFLPIIPKKLKPNQVTFVRLILSPFLIPLLASNYYIISLVLFIILAISDMLDGSLARLRDQITDWGKIWDPIADKLLIGSVVVSLLLKVNLNLTILLLAFEIMFIMGGAFAKMHNMEVQANKWGKIKMNFQAFAGGFLILGFFLNFEMMIFGAQVLLYLSLPFALLSMLRKGI